MDLDLITIGDANLDLLLQVKDFPALDDEVDVCSYRRMPGGDAANIAAAGAKLGLKTAILACIGDDEEGIMLTRAFETCRVNTSLLQRSTKNETGLAVAAVRSDGLRNLYLHRGANNDRLLNDQFVAALRGTSMLHISDPLEGEVKTLTKILKLLPSLQFSIDPGAVTARRGLDPLKPLLEKAAICFLNEGEARLLTSCDGLSGAIDLLLASGPEIIVVKQGATGCLVATKGSQTTFPGFNVAAADSTGAGDAFDAGFLFAWHRGKSLADAGWFANAVGALTTCDFGAQSSQPTLREVEAFISGVTY
jgi:ribokinase